MASPLVLSPIEYSQSFLSNWKSEHGNILPQVSSLTTASCTTRGDFLALTSNPADLAQEILEAFLVRISLYPRNITEITSNLWLTEAYFGRGLLHIIVRWKLLTLSPRAYSTLIAIVSETSANNIIVDLRDEQGDR